MIFEQAYRDYLMQTLAPRFTESKLTLHICEDVLDILYPQDTISNSDVYAVLAMGGATRSNTPFMSKFIRPVVISFLCEISKTKTVKEILTTFVTEISAFNNYVRIDCTEGDLIDNSGFVNLYQDMGSPIAEQGENIIHAIRFTPVNLSGTLTYSDRELINDEEADYGFRFEGESDFAKICNIISVQRSTASQATSEQIDGVDINRQFYSGRSWSVTMSLLYDKNDILHNYFKENNRTVGMLEDRTLDTTHNVILNIDTQTNDNNTILTITFTGTGD